MEFRKALTLPFQGGVDVRISDRQPRKRLAIGFQGHAQGKVLPYQRGIRGPQDIGVVVMAKLQDECHLVAVQHRLQRAEGQACNPTYVHCSLLNLFFSGCVPETPAVRAFRPYTNPISRRLLMYLVMVEAVTCGMSFSEPILASCTAARNLSAEAGAPSSGNWGRS